MVSGTFDRIGNAPESCPAWPRTQAAAPPIRMATVRRFPYPKHPSLASVGH